MKVSIDMMKRIDHYRRRKFSNFVIKKLNEYDVLMLGGQEFIHYAIGYESMPGTHRRQQRMALLYSRVKEILIIPYAEIPAYEQQMKSLGHSLDDEPDLVGYGNFFFDGDKTSNKNISYFNSFNDAVRGVIRKEFNGVKRWFVDDGISADIQKVLSSLGNEKVLDITHSLQGIREQKSDDEIVLLKYVANTTEDAISFAEKRLEVGRTEEDVASDVSVYLVSHGCMPIFVCVTVGIRSALSDVLPTATSIKRGDVIRFDIGASFHGYNSDIGRCAVMSPCSKNIYHEYKALLTAQQAEIKLIAPCVATEDVFNTAIQVCQQYGIPKYQRNHCGHGIGMSTYEYFQISSADTHRFVPRNVVSVETPYYRLGHYGLMVEDTILVTEHGSQRITNSSRELQVIS